MKRNVIGLTLLLALISTGCEDDSNKDLNINYSLPKLLEEIIFETIDGVEKERKRTYHWDGNTRTRYYRDSSGYGNETSDVQQINIYDEYGYLIAFQGASINSLLINTWT